jgi:hypothetical protein
MILAECRVLAPEPSLVDYCMGSAIRIEMAK